MPESNSKSARTNKTIATQSSPVAFINSIEDATKRNDCKKVAKLMREATGKRARMWGTSIVGYGSYHYKYDSGREGDMPVVGFSPRKQNLVVYIMPGFDQYSSLLGKLGKHSLKAFPSLIRLVGGKNEYVAYTCDKALESISMDATGQRINFGFDPAMKSKQRRSVMRQWDDWWQENRERLLQG